MSAASSITGIYGSFAKSWASDWGNSSWNSRKKTRVIEFTRFETKKSETFTFLGFEYRWGLSRKGKPLVKMRTAQTEVQDGPARDYRVAQERSL